MPTLTALAHAKLNLTLDVLGRRSDGYHDLRMVMTSVALADVITLETGTGDGVRASANLGFLPTGEKNLAASALLRFQEATGRDLGGAHISLEKHIPVCAGMGGGSSDAAAVLRALNDCTGAGLFRSWPGWGRRWAPTCPTVCWAAPPWRRDGGRSSRRWPRCPAVRW